MLRSIHGIYRAGAGLHTDIEETSGQFSQIRCGRRLHEMCRFSDTLSQSLPQNAKLGRGKTLNYLGSVLQIVCLRDGGREGGREGGGREGGRGGGERGEGGGERGRRGGGEGGREGGREGERGREREGGREEEREGERRERGREEERGGRERVRKEMGEGEKESEMGVKSA